MKGWLWVGKFQILDFELRIMNFEIKMLEIFNLSFFFVELCCV